MEMVKNYPKKNLEKDATLTPAVLDPYVMKSDSLMSSD